MQYSTETWLTSSQAVGYTDPTVVIPGRGKFVSQNHSGVERCQTEKMRPATTRSYRRCATGPFSKDSG